MQILAVLFTETGCAVAWNFLKLEFIYTQVDAWPHEQPEKNRTGTRTYHATLHHIGSAVLTAKIVSRQKAVYPG